MNRDTCEYHGATILKIIRTCSGTAKDPGLVGLLINQVHVHIVEMNLHLHKQIGAGNTHSLQKINQQTLESQGWISYASLKVRGMIVHRSSNGEVVLNRGVT